MTDTTTTQPKPPVEPPCQTCGATNHTSTSGYHDNQPTGYHDNSVPAGDEETVQPTGYHDN